MGSGKSSVGKRIANRLGTTFVDLDTMIEEYANASVQQIFEESGEESFRALETHMLTKVLDQDDIVVATGGGTPCHSGNMDKMLDHGMVVYLELSPDKLVKRVTQGRSTRPLVAGKEGAELRAYIEQHLESRMPHYTRADITVDADRINANVLDEIKEAYLDRLK